MLFEIIRKRSRFHQNEYDLSPCPMLLNAHKVCACDVASGIGKSAATTSHHLKLLRAAGLVATGRRGTWIYYRVLPERLAQLSAALQITPAA